MIFKEFPIKGLTPIELLRYTDTVSFYLILIGGDPMEQQKKDLPACPVETTLTLIGDKWKVLILRDLLPGTKRFGELKKSIGHVLSLIHI